MSRTPKKKVAPPSVTEYVTEFEVDSGGTLSMLGHYQPKTRAEFYEDVAGYRSVSPQALADAMDECQPLAGAVQSAGQIVSLARAEDIDWALPRRCQIPSSRPRCILL